MKFLKQSPPLARLVAVLFAIALLAFAQSAAAEARRYILPGNTVFPEGIAFQPSTNDFFVSSTTDGTIFRAGLEDETAEIFLPGNQDGRTFAAGLAVSTRGHLFVSGGATGQMFVYDINSRQLLGRFAHGNTPTFVNDVAATPDGNAYFTDSQSPFLYRLSPDGAGGYTYESWLNFTGTALQYQQGFNLNGIAASEDGRWLVVVQSNTGKLFRISTETKEVVEINIGAETVQAGDGVEISGNMIWVVRNQLGLVVGIETSGDLSSGRVVAPFTDPAFQFPTTAAFAGGRLLVVNSQFNNRGEGRTPNLPFTVVAVDVPGQPGTTPGMPRTGASAEQGVYLLALALLALAGATMAGGAWLRRRA